MNRLLGPPYAMVSGIMEHTFRSHFTDR
jgi:hypothetical protein